MPNFNPKNPSKYLGTNKFIVFNVTRNRQPTLADYIQPETGTYYSIGTVWQIGKNPTTGIEGELWMLSKIVANQGYWIQISSSTILVTSFAVQTGTSPVVPAAGLVTFNGAVVAAGNNPVRTDGTGANTMALEVQISQAIASTNATNIGLSAYNSAHFSVDANGFVSLLGGGQAIDSIGVDANTAPGTNPVIPTVLGLVTVTGGQVAAATTANVIRTISLAANTYTVQIQRSKTESSSTVGSNGVSHFDSNQFSVDSNGFVSLPGVTNTFTPTLAFGGGSTGITYVTNEGRYTVVANMVFFSIYIALSSKGSSTGNAAIAGLPVNVGGISSQVGFIEIDLVTFDAGFNAPYLRPLTGSSKTIELWQSGDNIVGDHLDNTNFANGSTIRCQGFYFT